MNVVTTIIFMILIGALIGGMTNSVAIKMLFRPHRPIYIGGKRLPFTPGLIPKRRDELAAQLGKMVVEHLLTAESIRKKIMDDQFQHRLTTYVQTEMNKLYGTSITVKEIAEKMGISNLSERANEKLAQVVAEKFEQYMVENRTASLRTIFNEKGLQKVNETIESVTGLLLQKGSSYFASEAGKITIENMVDDFFQTRTGKLSGMLQMFLGNVHVAEKIQPEVIKFLESDATQELMLSIVKKEVDNLLDLELEQFETQFGREKISGLLQKQVEKMVHIDGLINQPIAEFVTPYKEKIEKELIPQLVMKASFAISDRVQIMMEKFGLEQIVREQVESFPTERLEEIILSISRREFKLITYLGALLGGLIGFMQGIIVLLF